MVLPPSKENALGMRAEGGRLTVVVAPVPGAAHQVEQALEGCCCDVVARVGAMDVMHVGRRVRDAGCRCQLPAPPRIDPLGVQSDTLNPDPAGARAAEWAVTDKAECYGVVCHLSGPAGFVLFAGGERWQGQAPEPHLNDRISTCSGRMCSLWPKGSARRPRGTRPVTLRSVVVRWQRTRSAGASGRRGAGPQGLRASGPQGTGPILGHGAWAGPDATVPVMG